METFFDWSMILGIVGVLVVLTNIITQVLKQSTWDKLPTNLLAVAVSMVLTVVAFVAYCQMQDIEIVWYTAVAAVVLGFLVAYAAMFGFDKLKETLAQLTADETGDEDQIATLSTALSELVGMTISELKEIAEVYGVDLDGLTLKKEIAAAVMAAILTQAKAEQEAADNGEGDGEDA